MLMLDVEYDFDFLTLGIASREPAYRVSWFLNKRLGIHLQREPENYLIMNENTENHHLIYFYFCEDELIEYTLIKNKSENIVEEVFSDYSLFDTKNKTSYLIPEQPKIDYFLKVTELSKSDDLLTKTRNISLFNAVFDIDVYGLKSKENLIFD